MTDAVHERLARNLASGALTLALADIAEEAGRVILPFWRSDVAVQTKADQSPVTLADQKAEALILQLRAQGVTLLVAEQNMRFCMEIASSVAVVDHGCIVFTGSLQEFRNNPEVASRYLAV